MLGAGVAMWTSFTVVGEIKKLGINDWSVSGGGDRL